MYEFDSVSVSSLEAAALAAMLTERSADGWDVVGSCPAGATSSPTCVGPRVRVGDSETTTRRRRPSPMPDGRRASPSAAGAAGRRRRRRRPTCSPATRRASSDAGRHRRTPAGASSPTPRRPPGGARRSPTSAWGGSAPAADAAARPSQPTPAVPAGWYADPAGRYELRYWDGWAWTEHVSRGRPAVHRPACRLTGRAGRVTERDHGAWRHLTPDARHVARPCRHPHRDRPRGSIVCDPWFIPAFFGSWFVFPRNDQLDDELMAKDRERRLPLRLAPARRPLRRAVAGRPHPPRHRRARPRLPEPRARPAAQGARLHEPHPHRDGEETDLGAGLTVAIHVETSITDGPGGDSAIVVSDGTMASPGSSTRTTAAPPTSTRSPPTGPSTCTGCSTAGRSGTRWSTRWTPATMRHLVDAKVESQLDPGDAVRRVDQRQGDRAQRRPTVLPRRRRCSTSTSIAGDEPSIFVDQRTFLDRLDASGHRGLLAIPGTAIDVAPDAITVSHPIPEPDVVAIFERKGEYLARVPGRLGAAGSATCTAVAGAAGERPGGDVAGVVGAAARGVPDGARGHRCGGADPGR